MAKDTIIEIMMHAVQTRAGNNLINASFNEAGEWRTMPNFDDKSSNSACMLLATQVERFSNLVDSVIVIDRDPMTTLHCVMCILF